MQSLSELFESAQPFILSFFQTLEAGVKIFFQDTPQILGLNLGWWFLIFGFISFLIAKIGDILND